MATNDAAGSAYVTLVSSDGFEFHIRRSAAVRSGTIRRMLDMHSMATEESLNKDANSSQATSARPSVASVISRT